MEDEELIEAEGQDYYERKFREHCELVDCLTWMVVFLLGIGAVCAAYKLVVWLVGT